MELIRAVQKDDPSEIQKLLLTKANLNVNHPNINFYGWTPLHYGCGFNYFEVVRLLLEHKDINVNIVDSNGRTPFLTACWHGYTETVQVLLRDDRVDVNCVDEDSFTPLMKSCFNGKTQTVKVLIQCTKVNWFAVIRDYFWDDFVYKSGSTVLDITRKKEMIEKEEEERKQYVEIVKILKETLKTLYLQEAFWTGQIIEMFQSGEVVLRGDLKDYKEKLISLFKSYPNLKEIK
jgi:hypothetical protein